mgnify:CR=1 FL=1
MPRNPHKTPCSVPGCRSWAMRDGDRCRSHRDPELGPRGGGAPPGNLNALACGEYSHPLPLPELEHLAQVAIDHPADLPLQVGLALRAIQARVSDPFLVLVALCRLCSLLLARVAVLAYAAELDAFLARFSPRAHPRVHALLDLAAPFTDPVARLLALRKTARRRKSSTGTELDG